VWWKLAVQLIHNAPDTISDFNRIGAGLLDNIHSQTGPVVNQRSAAAILNSIYYSRHVGQKNWPVLVHRHDQIMKFLY